MRRRGASERASLFTFLSRHSWKVKVSSPVVIMRKNSKTTRKNRAPKSLSTFKKEFLLFFIILKLEQDLGCIL